MSELVTSFAEFRNLVNESISATEMNESKVNTDSVDTSLRTIILSFISEEGTISKKNLLEFFSLVEEKVGQKPSWSWLRKNSHLIDSELDENGETIYSLTKRGQRVLEVYKNYEKLSKTNTIDESVNAE